MNHRKGRLAIFRTTAAVALVAIIAIGAAASPAGAGAAPPDPEVNVESDTAALGDFVGVSGSCPDAAEGPAIIILAADVDIFDFHVAILSEESDFEESMHIPVGFPEGEWLVALICPDDSEATTTITIDGSSENEPPITSASISAGTEAGKTSKIEGVCNVDGAKSLAGVVLTDPNPFLYPVLENGSFSGEFVPDISDEPVNPDLDPLPLFEVACTDGFNFWIIDDLGTLPAENCDDCPDETGTTTTTTTTTTTVAPTTTTAVAPPPSVLPSTQTNPASLSVTG